MDKVKFMEFCVDCKTKGNVGYSQNIQDLWVIFGTNYKTLGYFVDFGATDGITINNTYMLEKDFGWTGIVAEPNPVYHDAIKKNRQCSIETSCVWKTSGGKIDFISAPATDLSTISGYGTEDEHSAIRAKGNIISVDTISLEDLLNKYDAPNNIDYLSIDTEGSEYDILRQFMIDNKGKRTIDYITIEHNYVPAIRQKIYQMLTINGYDRLFEDLSGCDDFYKRR